MKKLILLLTQLFCHHKYQYTEINHDGLNTMECKWCGKKKVVKVLTLFALAFLMRGCIIAWDSLDTENNKEYVVYSVDFRKGQYIYCLQDVGETKFLLPNKVYTATEQYNIGDTIIIKVEVKN